MADSEIDVYQTLYTGVNAEYKVKGSRFLGLAAPVQNEKEAESIIHDISRRLHDATHHCYAYTLGTDEQRIDRYSDAGEPSGTAGRPIMESILGRRLVNVLCVVTRYFGGTRLGTGGLARAYAECTNLTLDAATLVKHYIMATYHAAFPYTITGSVMKVINQYEVDIVQTLYGEKTEMDIRIRKSLADNFEKDIRDATAGKIQLKREEPVSG